MEETFPLLPEISESGIAFHFEDIDKPEVDFSAFPDWIIRVIKQHKATLGAVQYVFCSDTYLHRLNVEYLDHDTLTDIITFPYAAPPIVSGDLYISLDRVAENAKELSVPFANELQRVIIHGVLHLCGYGDKTPAEAKRMRELEEEALSDFDH